MALDTAPPIGTAGPPGATIHCDGLVKIYKTADLEVVALQALDLHVAPGEFVAIVGASGSGKSTLLSILGGLDTATAGQATVADHDLTAMRGRHRTRYRRQVVGFVWQEAARNLLPYLTALENVELALRLGGVTGRARRTRATRLLRQVGLDDRHDHVPAALSGGEQQRVAIAVALANAPRVLLADEPTGELDSATSEQILRVLRRVNEELGVTIVVLTHDPLVSGSVRRTIRIRDGRISTETLRRRRAEGDGHDGHDVVAEELAVIDRAGRLQLPREYVEALGLERRVRLELERDHVSIWPDREQRG